MNKNLYNDYQNVFLVTGQGGLNFAFNDDELQIAQNGSPITENPTRHYVNFDGITVTQIGINVGGVAGGGGLLTVQAVGEEGWVDVVSISVSATGTFLSAATPLPVGVSGITEVRGVHNNVPGASAHYTSIDLLGS